MQCPSCGARLARPARFCDQCGTQLARSRGAQATDAPPAMDVGDRRVVTALFADLVDYVRMLAEHDPEEVRARVGTALVRMGDAIERLGGTREKFIGDAVFAVFGWPLAHDDDPVRAALAALEIRATLLEPEDGGEPLEVRIGLATGEVVAAARGDSTGDLAVTGEAITTAARIQALARPGEILLDEATVRGARERLSVEDRGSVVLRGQSLVVRLFSLSGQSGLADPGSRRPTPDTPLVGRMTELGRLRRTLKRARRSGRGAVVLVTGDAGMGKSRLVADVEGHARELGFAWSWTESVSYGRGEPYRFGRQFAQVIADEHGVDSGSYARHLLFGPATDDDALRRYGGAIAAVARDASFSGWEAEAVHVPKDPAEVAANLAEVAAAYVQRTLETDGPRVVVLDDLHWLDTSSTAMIELLVATAAIQPLVILATTRPGMIPSWAMLDHVERIDLNGLAPAETGQLATLVARAALDAGDARRIHERTQGNPLFIGEIVRASIEDGTLELRDGRMVLMEPSAPRLPLTLRAVLGARLDGLDDPTRDVLSVASVIGIGFRLEELEDLLGEPIPLGTLERLVDAALMVQAGGSGTWRFSHPLVHEAAYAGMLATRRRRLHARVADRLEARPPVSIERLAVHRAAAGDAAAAIPLLNAAANAALAVGAPNEAAAFWRNAADLASDSEEIARFRAAATAALEAARG